MNARQISKSDNGARTFALIFDTGDQITGNLQRFAQDNHLRGSHFTAIGALSDAVIAWFDWEGKKYRHISINEQVEVLSLIGDIAEDDGEPKIHAHIVLGKADGSAHGGHLVEAHVRPTLEVILTESPQHLQRRFDETTGLTLIRF
jgi:predicted DNA-binding protein with PD1-like motif